MADEWREVPLGELADIFDGPHATPPKTTDGPIFLGISNLSNGRLDLSQVEHLSNEDFVRWTRRVVPRQGDIVFSYETRLGEAAIVPRNLRCCLGRRMGLLRARPGKVDGRFLLYAYMAPEFQATLRARTIHGSTVDRIPLIDLPDFPIRIPVDIAEQAVIGRILGALDDKIELNRRMADMLESMARALFKSWFVDFDPVRAKAEDRPTGLPEEVAGLFPDRFDEKGAPAGWEITSIEALAEINPPTTLKVGSAAPYVDMAALPTQFARIETWIERAVGSGARFKNRDTLIARITPCLENGKTALVDFLTESQAGWGSTEFIVVRPRSGVPAGLPYLLARHEPFRTHLIGSMTGTSGRQRVPPSAVTAWEIAKPDAGVLTAFGKIIDPLFERVGAAGHERQTLAALRDTLLPKLISGELRVGDAEKRIAAA